MIGWLCAAIFASPMASACLWWKMSSRGAVACRRLWIWLRAGGGCAMAVAVLVDRSAGAASFGERSAPFLCCVWISRLIRRISYRVSLRNIPAVKTGS